MSEQTATDTDATQGKAEETDAQEPSLDELLNEYNSGDSQKGADLSKEDIASLHQEIRQFREEQARNEEQEVISRVGKRAAEEARAQGINLDEEVFADLFLAEVSKNRDKFLPAYLDRKSNPKKWAEIESASIKKIASRMSNVPDSATTQDRDALAQAVRGASDKAPERGLPANLSELSDFAFEKLKRRVAKGQ